MPLDPIDADAADEDLAAVILDEPPPPPVRRALMARTLRQAKPPNRVTGELPWWATASRDGFTTAAQARAPEMSKTPEARFVKGITIGEV